MHTIRVCTLTRMARRSGFAKGQAIVSVSGRFEALNKLHQMKGLKRFREFGCMRIVCTGMYFRLIKLLLMKLLLCSSAKRVKYFATFEWYSFELGYGW